jgi:hypothetical protein
MRTNHFNFEFEFLLSPIHCRIPHPFSIVLSRRNNLCKIVF